MCGILALLADNCPEEQEDLRHLIDSIDKRGPDYSSPLIAIWTYHGLQLRLKSSVLHLRGDTLQEQPIVDEACNVLLFNGQIYQFAGQPINCYQSDTTFLSKKLSQCKSPYEIAETFTEIEGPFAIIYWHHKFRKLFYGRDLFGRRSLCVLREDDSCPLIISSVATEKLQRMNLHWQEVRTDGLLCIDYNTKTKPIELIFPWDLDSIYPKTSRCIKLPDLALGGDRLKLSLIKPLNNDLTEPSKFDDKTKQSVVEKLEKIFTEAVKIRYIYNQSRCLKCRKNVENLTTTKRSCRDSKVAVGFSGGVDSTLIAMALDKVVELKETIDLVTVSFKEDAPDRDSAGKAFKEIRDLCPKRNWRLVVCDVSKIELQRERDRHIRELILPCQTNFDDSIGCASWFISRAMGRAIDSSLGDQWISTHFDKFLAYDPSNSYVNDQIMIEYQSPASMIFVGSSIDEQLGGYSSFRKAWSESGTLGLINEVSYLMRRISSRNLGRDDRVYSQHGRDVKIPFLDSSLISFLNELPMGIKMNLDEPIEYGPKKIIRELALRWGLNETGKRTKRAMQFGTRIANLEGTKEKANEMCPRLRTNTDETMLVDLVD